MDLTLNDIADELIIIPKMVLDKFLTSDKPAELIALYSFYYYTAKWQKTNQPKCTTGYAAKGLHWKEDKVRKVKNKLKDLELIQDIRQISKKTRKVTGWFIKINYIFKKSTKITKNHPPPKPLGWKNQTVDSGTPNALSTNTKNALSTGKNIAMALPSLLQEDNMKLPADDNYYSDDVVGNTPIVAPGITAGARRGGIEDTTKLYKYIKINGFNKWDKLTYKDMARIILGLFRTKGWYKDYRIVYGMLCPKVKNNFTAIAKEDRKRVILAFIDVYNNFEKYNTKSCIGYMWDANIDYHFNPIGVLSPHNVKLITNIYCKEDIAEEKKVKQKSAINCILENIYSKYMTKAKTPRIRSKLNLMLLKLEQTGDLTEYCDKLNTSPKQAFNEMPKKYTIGFKEVLDCIKE